MEPTIRLEPPTSPEVKDLLEVHLDFSRAASPPGHVHALDYDGLSAPDVSFYVVRDGDKLLGVGALRDLGERRGEIKSMHTVATARGRGVGRLLVEHLINTARDHNMTWLGLETGTMDEFAPARQLYESVGFAECEPFRNYTVNPHSKCMSMELDVPSG